MRACPATRAQPSDPRHSFASPGGIPAPAAPAWLAPRTRDAFGATARRDQGRLGHGRRRVLASGGHGPAEHLASPSSSRRFDVVFSNSPYVPAPEERLPSGGPERAWDADEPDLEGDVAFGCAATVLVEDRLAAHLREAWARGGSSLRTALPEH
ncbi:hypothetical protein [Streptomyces sp. Mg1]|uniref:hypothetical protein n=1 Tax=Streptomyces sp. Mg1 TaxID=465541 RepID=UPI00017EACA0|nr:hypothetical protein M444_03300 [Streptomyces sp. Mg1]EDX20790.1 hypothetical protein SSAG_00581 [Streptomyces sp. Mg1]